MPSPWVLLGGLLGAIALVVSTWIYKGNIDATHEKAAIQAMQIQADKAHLDALHVEQAKTAAAEAEGKRNVYAYQANLDKLNRDLAAAHDTHNQLLNAVTVYAAYAPGGGNTSACNVPLSEAEQRTGRLANVLTLVVAAGERMAESTTTCAVRLTACEAYADSVEKEYGVTGGVLRRPAGQPPSVVSVPARPLPAPSNLLGDHPFPDHPSPP